MATAACTDESGGGSKSPDEDGGSESGGDPKMMTSGAGEESASRGGETGGMQTDTGNATSDGSSSAGDDTGETSPVDCERGTWSCPEGCCEFAVEVVDAEVFAGTLASIALDDEGQPFIAHRGWGENHQGDIDSYFGIVRLSVPENGAWNSRSLIPYRAPSVAPKVGVTADGDPYVYFFGENGTHRVATRSSGWNEQEIDLGGSDFRVHAITQDASGRSHMLLTHLSDDLFPSTHHAVSADGYSWDRELVTDFGPYNEVAFALDGQDAPHYTLRLDIDGEVQWSYGSSPEGFEVIGDQFSHSLGMAIDSEGTPHIVAALSDSLIYASRSDGRWAIETLDDDFDAADTQSHVIPQLIVLRIDEHDRLSLAYYDVDASVGRFARRIEGEWVIDVFDGAPRAGQNPAMVLDDEGRPHIAYHDHTLGVLKYATLVGS